MTAGGGQPADRAAQATLGRLIVGYRVTHIIGLAARLGIADRLGDGPKSADELALLVGADSPALARLLRALVGLRVLLQRAGFGLGRVIPTGGPLAVLTAEPL
jgi:hypothetical protein